MDVNLFDSHCHLNIEEYFPDPSPFFERALSAGVRQIALVGLDPISGRRAVEMAEAREGVYAIVGRHPNYAADYASGELEIYRELLKHPKTVALGEMGLDYHWDFS